jgi:hypothetical protein
VDVDWFVGLMPTKRRALFFATVAAQPLYAVFHPLYSLTATDNALSPALATVG